MTLWALQHSLEFIVPFGTLDGCTLAFGHVVVLCGWAKGNYGKDPTYGMYQPQKYVDVKVKKIPSEKLVFMYKLVIAECVKIWMLGNVQEHYICL